MSGEESESFRSRDSTLAQPRERRCWSLQSV